MARKQEKNVLNQDIDLYRTFYKIRISSKNLYTIYVVLYCFVTLPNQSLSRITNATHITHTHRYKRATIICGTLRQIDLISRYLNFAIFCRILLHFLKTICLSLSLFVEFVFHFPIPIFTHKLYEYIHFVLLSTTHIHFACK